MWTICGRHVDGTIVIFDLQNLSKSSCSFQCPTWPKGRRANVRVRVRVRVTVTSESNPTLAKEGERGLGLEPNEANVTWKAQRWHNGGKHLQRPRRLSLNVHVGRVRQG